MSEELKEFMLSISPTQLKAGVSRYQENADYTHKALSDDDGTGYETSSIPQHAKLLPTFPFDIPPMLKQELTPTPAVGFTLYNDTERSHFVCMRSSARMGLMTGLRDYGEFIRGEGISAAIEMGKRELSRTQPETDTIYLSGCWSKDCLHPAQQK